MIEILRFRLQPSTSVDEFLAADKKVQTAFAYQQPGLLRRTTARGRDDEWIVIDLWESDAHADACDARWGSDPVTAAFMALIDPGSIHTARYDTLD
jgi:hypothetical protein